ncbi:histidine phosphatase family protein [Subsaximicrobium wynnwilliamsii]|uniref:Histidine phosphatase family protein n=1 Tax=Subsaximicrobium wynnwilliamsii TaxID=291179 RepID=A0A5C6ZNH9_9FLAO|nr:phosphoglycerate mutase family protein [Subsaximicrobium wynnwilliamsii]TXD85132.1 histidine phosphatase family protein [Subsaximicrobium wynnwilliamsii]TXD91175.1 histidine phosphatase family protein [Subsaximicrobium wynnwilliamsii]TXE04569.1 histidine phosphatase family protein [Subsaximicrobium wynnwilliamsii]
MKLFFILTFTFLFGMNSQAQNEATHVTTYYLIRHAEKDRSDGGNKNPNLNNDGQKRAQLWRYYFKNIKLDAVYATNYNRTKQTAKPIAESKELEIQIYDANDLFSEAFKEATKGKSVLVVGHSNTTPAFANAILGKQSHDDLNDGDNSKLFVITISGGEVFQELLTIE